MIRKLLSTITDELKRGENIDLYPTILFALVATVLGLIDYVSSVIISKLTLGLLALLAVSSLVSRHYFRNLADKFSKPSTSIATGDIQETGLLEYYSSREICNFTTIIQSAKKKFDCIGTSLPDIAADRNWKALKSQIQSNQNLTVRILLLNPQSIIAYRKSKLSFFRHKWKDIIDEINKSISVFKSIYSELQAQGMDLTGRYDIRVYSTIPTTSCVFNDSILNISFYDEKEPGSISPVWIFTKIDKERCLYNYYQENFDAIWVNALSVLDEDFENKIADAFKAELEGLRHALPAPRKKNKLTTNLKSDPSL